MNPARVRPRSSLAAVALLLLACWLGAPSARAQGLPLSDRVLMEEGAPEVSVRFGWDGLVRPERFAPIFVTLSGAERAFSGAVVLRFPQDGSQWAEVIAPAAATPGRASTVTVLAALPENASEMILELIDFSTARGRTVGRVRFDRAGLSERTVPMAQDAMPGGGLVLHVGRGGGLRSPADGVRHAAPTSDAEPYMRMDDVGQPGAARTGRSQPEATGTVARRWDRLRTAPVEPAAMARHWAAYDGVEGVVVDAEADLTDEQIDALLAYARAGGRLAVVAAGPGAGWQRFVPSGVSVGTLGEVRLPGEIARDVAGLRHVDAVRAVYAEFDHPRTRDAIREMREAIERARPPLVAHAPARPVTVREDLARDGWRVFWALGAPDDDSPDDPAGGAPGAGGATPAGLGASGPIGFGRLLVLGVSPGSLPARVDHDGEGEIWRVVLTGLLAEWLTHPIEGVQSWRPAVTPSGLDTGERIATASMLNRTARVEPVTWRVAAWLGAGLLLLALLVGPVDAIVLKKLKRRHLAWASALIWAGVAGVVAWWLPDLLRAGETRLDRASIVDVVQLDSADDAGPIVWSQGVVGVFAGRRDVIELAPSDRRDGARVWRGVSSLSAYSEALGASARTIRILQEGDALTPAPMPVSIWSFRTASDHGPGFDPEGRPAPRAELRQTEGDAWRVDLRALPPGARIGEAALRVGERWFPLASVQDGTGRTPGTATLRSSPEADGIEQVFTSPADLATGYGWWNSAVRGGNEIALSLGMAGPSRRAGGIDERVATGAWGAVYLELIEDEPGASGVASRWDSRWTLCRVLVPLATIDRVERAHPTEAPWARVLRETREEDER
ncbi:MAG: hypothetical protein EA378_03585 [Phycisphaerales bacterium]|nr:MAG: hypothetical protein EA378_03585 [Phycisphaerales bacterium]